MQKSEYKTVGKIISNKGGFSEAFKMINDKQYKKMMGIESFRKETKCSITFKIQKNTDTIDISLRN